MVAVIVGVVGAALLAGVGWVLVKVIGLGEAVAEMKGQYQNNGGSTMRDAVDRIEGKLNDHLIQAATAAAKFDAHLTAHPPATVIVQQAPPTPPQG